MNKSDYMAAVAKTSYDMHQEKLKYKYKYTPYERSLIYDIARKINRYTPVTIEDREKTIDDKQIYERFLSSLKELDSDFVYDYYKKMFSRMKLVRSGKVIEDDAELEYGIDNGRISKSTIFLPTKKLTVTNQIGFAHEMGHIPELFKLRESFFEYNEVLPFFFEYIAALDCYDKKSAKENFALERLSMIIQEAANILYYFKLCNSKENAKSLYYTQLFADNYKFFESFDFVLQLIDIYEKDKKIAVNEIEKVIKGKSLIDVSKDLEIDSSDCKRLLMEYKR